jgi:protein TonB
MPPEYPSVAILARVEGTVVLDGSVSEMGRIEDIEVVSGHPLLIDAAIDCVRQWEYAPAKLNDNVIRVPITVQVRFVIKPPTEQ